MDPYSSGEELIIKTRKPYTITKQRERWTEEEHSRFLEALKLYGRAWQRIEEHIGTKTAVQIRSHAQKFFTKLEKEALAKGVPIRQALDIEIPPPRPKRKPTNPYPRKTGLGAPLVAPKDGNHGTLATSVSSSHSGKHILNLGKDPLSQKTDVGEKLDNPKTDEEIEKCNEALSLFQEAPSVSASSAFENSISKPVTVDPCIFTEFVPVLKEVINQDETNESYITVETKEHQKLDKNDSKQTDTTSSTLIFGNCHTPHKILVHGQYKKLSQPGNFGASSINGTNGAQSYPRHVPVHIIDVNQEKSAKKNPHQETSFQESTLNHTGEAHEYPKLFTDLAASASSMHQNNASRSSTYQTVPSFHPLFSSAVDHQEDFRSFLHCSSTLSNLIVSSLLQNPAAHAAANFVATFWPNVNMEASLGDSLATDPPSTHLNTAAPSMAAIAAATVAAATAWWAAHGLLPICSPFHSGYSFTHPFASATPMDDNQAKISSKGPEAAFQEEKLDAEQCQSLLAEHPSFKSTVLSSSEDSDGTGDVELNNTGINVADTEEATPVAELHDSCKSKVRKQVDRSSCGSNTTSSSEIETDALEKLEKTEETKEPDVTLQCSDSINRRSRSFISPNESWKEVSEEGRLAFQALFSREVLPQSFSPPHDMDKKMQLSNNIQKDQNNIVKNSEAASRLDLNSKSWMTSSSQQEGTSTSALLTGEREGEERLLGLGNVKLKAHRTGFKPYKRCSIEAKESRIVSAGSQNDEKGPKRMRLEGDAST